MAVAITLAKRGVGQTGLNPSVGCIIVKDNRIVGRGWTQAGGRPHAEAMALEQAGETAKNATIYCTLEPCAHESERGPSCADLISKSGAQRVIIAVTDPDPRTNGKGIKRLENAGINVAIGCCKAEAGEDLKGFMTRITKSRPYITLKLATSLDGMIAMSNGESQWITGEAARAHTHVQRGLHDAIIVGGQTLRDDMPSLNVRINGLEDRAPEKWVLTRGNAPDGWNTLNSIDDITAIHCNQLMVEGGAETASAFLKTGLVDRIYLYRAPILLGAGKSCLRDIGLSALGDAHGQWHLQNTHMLGNDRMELYVNSKAI